VRDYLSIVKFIIIFYGETIHHDYTILFKSLVTKLTILNLIL